MTVHKIKTVTTSFEEYFKSQPAGTTQFRLVVTKSGKNGVNFYIHPFNKNGKTLDYSVDGNRLKCITQKAID